MCKKCCGESKNQCCSEFVNCCEPIMTDCLAIKIECIWKQAFCDAILIPIIGVPSCSCGVMTLTHSLGNCIPKSIINGLVTLSSLANNAFYSAEVSCGKWINLYKIIIPNIPGNCGCKSTGELYTNELVKLGISIEGDYYDWKGTCQSVISINSKAIGMHPIEFTKKQIAAIKMVLECLNKCC